MVDLMSPKSILETADTLLAAIRNSITASLPEPDGQQNFRPSEENVEVCNTWGKSKYALKMA